MGFNDIFHTYRIDWLGVSVIPKIRPDSRAEVGPPTGRSAGGKAQATGVIPKIRPDGRAEVGPPTGRSAGGKAQATGVMLKISPDGRAEIGPHKGGDTREITRPATKVSFQ